MSHVINLTRVNGNKIFHTFERMKNVVLLLGLCMCVCMRHYIYMYIHVVFIKVLLSKTNEFMKLSYREQGRSYLQERGWHSKRTIKSHAIMEKVFMESVSWSCDSVNHHVLHIKLAPLKTSCRGIYLCFILLYDVCKSLLWFKDKH